MTPTHSEIRKGAGVLYIVVHHYIPLLFLFLYSKSILRDKFRWLRFDVTKTLPAFDFLSFYFSQHDAFLKDLTSS